MGKGCIYERKIVLWNLLSQIYDLNKETGVYVTFFISIIKNGV